MNIRLNLGCALFVFAAMLGTFSFAHPLHLAVRDKSTTLIHFAKLVEAIRSPESALSELDEEGFTVFGRAIVEGRQDITELLLFQGYTDPGRVLSGSTLAEIAFQHNQINVHIFLLYFEYYCLNLYDIPEAIKKALLDQDSFSRQEALRATVRLLGPQPFQPREEAEPTFRPYAIRQAAAILPSNFPDAFL